MEATDYPIPENSSETENWTVREVSMICSNLLSCNLEERGGPYFPAVLPGSGSF